MGVSLTVPPLPPGPQAEQTGGMVSTVATRVPWYLHQRDRVRIQLGTLPPLSVPPGRFMTGIFQAASYAPSLLGGNHRHWQGAPGETSDVPVCHSGRKASAFIPTHPDVRMLSRSGRRGPLRCFLTESVNGCSFGAPSGPGTPVRGPRISKIFSYGVLRFSPGSFPRRLGFGGALRGLFGGALRGGLFRGVLGKPVTSRSVRDGRIL